MPSLVGSEMCIRDSSETTVIEENEGTDDGLSEEEPIQEEQIASQPHLWKSPLKNLLLLRNLQ